MARNLSHSMHQLLKTPVTSAIHEHLSEEQLEMIHEAIEETPEKKIDKATFNKLLKDFFGDECTLEELDVLFTKVDAKRDGKIDWDEFISHLLLEFQGKEVDTGQEQFVEPFTKRPIMIRSYHRHPVIKILFCPFLRPELPMSWTEGRYMTLSKDGIINCWDLSMDWDKSYKVTTAEARPRMQPTHITDFVALPDINIIATSATERDLRFFDTTANKFQLRMVIYSMEFPVICMSSHSGLQPEEDSHIIMGDVGGNVLVMFLKGRKKLIFNKFSNLDVQKIHYKDVLKGEVQNMTIIAFRGLHSDWVRKVDYWPSLSSFVSCSNSNVNSMCLCDVTGTKTRYEFNVNRGISCFHFSEEGRIIATGGQDRAVRVWNPFVPQRPSNTFVGHKTAIRNIVTLQLGKRVISVSKDRNIRVWGVQENMCLQTYVQLTSEIGGKAPLCEVYNPVTQDLIVASSRIAILKYGEMSDEELSDGTTHSKAVCKTLYNPLFNYLVTLGQDSCIFIWDLRSGRRILGYKDAHTRILLGEKKPVMITAATYDSSFQLLLTGATDGSIKMWNLNTGTIMRRMNIEANCEVTDLIWIRSRILVVGWNRLVTEFADSEEAKDGKRWQKRHVDDLLCAAVKVPEALATCSYGGEVILWKVETGQPYQRYLVQTSKQARMSFEASSHVLQTSAYSQMATHFAPSPEEIGEERYKETDTERKPSAPSLHKRLHVPLPPEYERYRHTAVHSVIFLTKRPMADNVGTVVVSLANGMIQVWSHGNRGGFISQFRANHNPGDYIRTMTTDLENEYLITGDTCGYLKVWLLANYALPDPPKVVLPYYRLIFPFLLKERFLGKAKRTVRKQPLPVLLSSHRGHLDYISHIEYIDQYKIYASSSADCSVRLWTLGGQYLATVGMSKPWPNISLALEPEKLAYRIPPDIKREASFTTMKVLTKGDNLMEMALQKEIERMRASGQVIQPLSEYEITHGTTGKRLTSPRLGKNFQLPPRYVHMPRAPYIDMSGAKVPVFSHLNYQELVPVERPPTPPLVREMRVQEKTEEKMKLRRKKRHVKTKPQTIDRKTSVASYAPSAMSDSPSEVSN